ncbi:MAG: YihA family ribosome biogenesis GTP-binding protein [Lachnospiraceae bacterium]|nr:YihA family ribosome biogenesis GTP-binding protein [Lachnospiraceae bacterium]
MIIKSAELETVCGVTSKLPDNQMPEFAFVGRSNVGKSSLINKLVNRKALARTSQQPGKTQTINYFRLNDSFYFVDLPGYGYAKVSKELQAKWGKMIERYLLKSKQLKLIFQLVDIRHEPSAGDKQMHDWIAANKLPSIVLVTKADKVSRSQISKQLAMIRKELKLKASDRLIACSKETRLGFDEVWGVMEEYLNETGAESPEEGSPVAGRVDN